MCYGGGGGGSINTRGGGDRRVGSTTTATPSLSATAPVRLVTGGLATAAANAAQTAKGVADTIFSSPLGDTDYGQFVKKATFLGETASYG